MTERLDDFGIGLYFAKCCAWNTDMPMSWYIWNLNKEYFGSLNPDKNIEQIVKMVGQESDVGILTKILSCGNFEPLLQIL